MLQPRDVQFIHTFHSIIPSLINQNTFQDEEWTKTSQHIFLCEKCSNLKKHTVLPNLQYSFDLYGYFVMKFKVEGGIKLDFYISV